MSSVPGFAGFHDPADVTDYLIKFDDLLETDETVNLSSIALNSEALAAGLQLGSAAYAAAATGKQVRFWLSCSQPENPAFANGLEAYVTATVTTSSTPARTFQRSVVVAVRQSSTGPAPVAAVSAVDLLRQKLAQAETALHLLLTTGQMTDVWRDGRRIRYSKTDTGDLRAYINDLRQQIAMLDPTGPEASQRRTAIGVRF